MALPRKLSVNIEKNNIGKERIIELLNNTNKNPLYFPKSIGFFDIDEGFFSLIENTDLKFIYEGIEVPTFFLTPERWGEFSKTWHLMDDNKNISFPFITVRRIAKEKGTYTSLRSTIPQNKLFQYSETAELTDNEIILKKYLIPQPTAIDQLDYFLNINQWLMSLMNYFLKNIHLYNYILM
jgi:hypothetical protein